MDAFTSTRDKTQWHWTAMIMVPDWMTAGMFATAVDEVGAKDAPARLSDLRLEILSEGTCVQVLHVGSYDDEGNILRRLHHEFIPSQGLKMVGRHHEIYLSDFRKVEPAKLRTILRQPVATS